MKKHRVRLRPKTREQRRSALGAWAALLLLASAGAGVLRAKPWASWSLRLPLQALSPRWARVESVGVSGAPAAIEAEILSAVGGRGEAWGPFEPYRLGADLERRFSCLRRARVSRSWRRRSVEISVELREPQAAVLRGGRRAGYLDRKGELFEAAEGTYDRASLPELDLTHWPQGGMLGPLAAFVEDVRSPGVLPAALARLRFEPEDEGWTAVLSDGTALFWGDLRWTRQKLERLKEVLADARPRFGKVNAVDLRYFEDGKMLVRLR